MQEAPTTIKVELTEGCPLRCPFCGLNGIRAKKNNFIFMGLAVAQCIADEVKRIGWNSRIEFALRGEPTANPQRLAIIRTLRSATEAYFLMETNGYNIVQNPLQRIVELFEAGLTTVAVDEYDEVNWADRIRRSVDRDALARRAGACFYEYPADVDENPHRRCKYRRLIIIAPLNHNTKGTHVAAGISNHCGAAGPLSDSHNGKRCTRPFREFSIRYDGQIMICCNDWRGVFRVGSIFDTPIDEVWNGPEFVALRRKLYYGERTFPPCLGKESLPRATAEDDAILAAGIRQGPMTLPILREWEQPTTAD